MSFASTDQPVQLSLQLVAHDSTASSSSRFARATDPLSAEQVEEQRYRRLLKRKHRQGDLSGVAACFIQLGDLLLRRGDSESAGDMYRQALTFSRQAHDHRQLLARS